MKRHNGAVTRASGGHCCTDCRTVQIDIMSMQLLPSIYRCHAPLRLAFRSMSRAAGSGASSRPPVGVMMLNMGGPSSLDGPEDGVEPFLGRLFGDGEIIQMGPLQSILVRRLQ